MPTRVFPCHAVTKALPIIWAVTGSCLLAGEALAQQAAAAQTVAVNPFPALFMGGVMGLVGQAARAIVSLTTLGVWNINKPPDAQDGFNAARLLVSFAIGFIAGFLTGLVQWNSSGAGSFVLSDFKFMMKFAVAGYIGTDVVEALTVRLFDKPTPTPAPAAEVAGPTPAQIALQITDVSRQMEDLKVALVQPSMIGVATPKPVYGFDTEYYPGNATMEWLRARADTRVSVCYLANYPGKPNESWIGVRPYLQANGWGALPTYAGLQRGHADLSKTSGERDGKEAAGLMKRAGFAAGSVARLDIEDGDPPSGPFLDYVTAWCSTLTADGYSPGLYCSHLISDWVRNKAKLTKIVWPWNVPHANGQKEYDPAALPPGSVDAGSVATQYCQKIELRGLMIPPTVDGEGLDLSLCLVADLFNYAVVAHALGLA